MFNGSKKNHLMCSLTALSKFLGIYKQFKELREGYGIKWGKGNTDILIINRLLKRDNSDDIEDWIRQTKSRIPKISRFLDLLIASGMRYSEALISYNLILNLTKIDKLNEYYVDNYLEHFRYSKQFIRRTKKVFISIVPNDVIKEISKSENLTYYAIKMRLQRRKIPLRFSDIREYWASKMTRYLSQPEIDFLMGHVSANVFMANYFNPKLINDLKERALEGVSELISS